MNGIKVVESNGKKMVIAPAYNKRSNGTIENRPGVAITLDGTTVFFDRRESVDQFIKVLREKLSAAENEINTGDYTYQWLRETDLND